jgi:hypothetical protein
VPNSCNRGANRQVEQRKIRRLYKTLFGKDFPADWSVSFDYGCMNAEEKWIHIFTSDCMEDALDTLIHEFVHMENPTWDHGAKFNKEVNRLLDKVLRY